MSTIAKKNIGSSSKVGKSPKGSGGQVNKRQVEAKSQKGKISQVGATEKALAKKVLKAFDELYPQAACSLDERDPYGLLVSTILSAQCTDARVNKVAPVLMQKYPTPEKMGGAPVEKIEQIIKSCGFFRMKANNIKNCSRALVERFGGKVPNQIDELISLPGVGRKTANCVVANAFGLPGITVDTHLGRIARRLGLTKNTDPAKVEADLAQLIPKVSWSKFSHQGIAHGRALCRSQRPLCNICPLKFCKYPEVVKAQAESKKKSSPKKSQLPKKIGARKKAPGKNL
ncbi:MAG: endonuclease III [Deltaproteobacteria bacterium]|jgi:endonuclease-3|nr:endonuclease III [Deltaproteobacteria bacterium]